MTPRQGLREFVGGVLKEPDENLRPVSTGQIILIVHGTFSESQAIFSQFADPKNTAGNALLARAATHYNQILAFDHPTMSVSPMLNAVDLARRLRDTNADIDVICHSRGGLVTRWWLEAFDRPAGKRRVVLVGCPLEGTSLASPPRLRSVLSWFSNLNKFIARGTSLIPFMTVVSCLARLTATVTSVAAQTPIVDAAMAMIPGLAAMSRIDNNLELGRLNGVLPDSLNYFVMKSRFKPSDPGWKFWEYFVDQPLQRAAHSLFPGDNDLVVDTASMTVLQTAPQTTGRKVTEIGPKQVYDFGETSSIYHTNYFSQPQTATKIFGLASDWRCRESGPELNCQCGRIEVGPVAQDDDGELLLREALDGGSKTRGASEVPHSRRALERIEKPAEAVRDGFSRREIVSGGFTGPTRFAAVVELGGRERRFHLFFGQ